MVTKNQTLNIRKLVKLEKEIDRLEKVNAALVSRVEREAASKTESAYSLFETAATLENAVEQRTTELLHVNNLLLKEIDRRESIEKQLKHAKDDAELANRNKTQFLVAVSHDLNQPLTAAHLMTGSLIDVLEHKPLNLDSLMLYSSRISTSLETMEHLLNSLIDISKLEAGVVDSNIYDFSVGPLLSQLETEYRLQAQRRGLVFRYVPSTAVVNSDPILLGRVLRNFISNAMRYTDQGKILLGCRRKNNVICIEVWDTGSGIPKSQTKNIFKEFRQLPNANKASEKGLGLGLTIVERIVRMLDARVYVKSTPRKGSVFAVEIPYGNRAKATEYIANTSSFNADEFLINKTIFLIEDDKPSLEALKIILEGWGCEVVGASSFREIKKQIKSSGIVTPDLIIADYHLDHGPTGIEVINNLKSEYTTSCPLLIVTSDQSAKIRKLVKQNGCHYMYKPLKPAKLRAFLNHTLCNSASVSLHYT